MRRPNVILINCDDLGYGDLGCYGSPVNATPALDRMADEGLRFTDFYMASPVCSPSRGAMLTGCYPPRIGFGDFDGMHVLFPGHAMGLNPSEITFARLLQEQGYATKIVGKWHCGDQPDFFPTRHGFDSWYGIPYSNDMGRQSAMEGMPSREELGEMFGLKFPTLEDVPLPLMRDEEVIEEQPDQASLTERYVEECVRFIRDNRDKPFFLYFAHMYVHLPIYVQARFLEESDNGPYGAAVQCIDWATDVILTELRRLGLDDDTMVIFTSDNGSLARDGGSNDPLREKKATTWEGGQRVPCIVRWPGKVPAGATTSELATAMDLYPTLARLGGAEVPTDRTIDGRDISDLLFGVEGAVSPHDAFFYYFGDSLEAVRVERWKLHCSKWGTDISELYDLEADIGETTDVSADHPDVVAELTAHVDRARADLGDARLGLTGSDRRPHGTVDDATTITLFDPDHPYYMAEYDLPDRG